ncbi:tetratricopeptide repeat protein [Parapedobacter sp. 2B3]|uniref:tetratricopeptide repeat protein n=1 Tax=Parapedobacter sp. 2B3 TaxID=3342381 RepID=UPI0035B5BA38
MDRYPLLLFAFIGYLLFAILPPSFAQQDTLWQAFSRIADAEQEGRDKVDSLNAFAHQVLEIDGTLADSVLVLARQLARRQAYVHGEAVSLYLRSHCEEAHGSIKDAEAAILAAISLFEKEPPQPVSIRAYLHAGWLYRRLLERGKAMEYGMKGLKLAEQTRDTANIGNGYNQLAILYVDIEDYEKALEYHQKALHWRQLDGNAVSIALSLGNIGIVNMRLGHYDAALAAHKRGLQTVIEAGDRSEEAFFYNDIGSTYLYKGDADSAIHYLKKSIAMREAMQETNEIAYTYNYLGEAYEKAGDIRGAERWIKKALQTAIDIDNTKQHQEALESLSGFYARSQQYDSAYTYLYKHKVYSDSIAQSDREKLIDELAAQYETGKKEQQIEILHQQTALQKLRLRQRGGAPHSSHRIAIGIGRPHLLCSKQA